MMTPEPESTRNYHDPVTASGDGFMGLFEELSREEILEVLSEGFCHHCGLNFEERIRNLPHRKVGAMSLLNKNGETSPESFRSMSNLDSMTPASHQIPFHSTKRLDYSTNSSPSSLTSKQHFNHHDSEIPLNDGVSGPNSAIDYGMPEEQKDRIRFSQVGRKKDFVYVEKINGKPINVVQGLELYTRVFNYEEQKRIVECVYDLQRMGQMGRLRERTYSEPRKWMRGKGRVTIQFGCCYNYAVDKSGNPPGIVRDEEVDPLPQLFKQMIRRMVRWHIVPPDCVPDSCIVNIYDEGDCIPPHIDHHDFLRPFCTVSFLAECNILFGSNLKIVSPGEFSGPVSIPLPVGSVLILNGNGADVAKHCIPAVPTRRISITFRKMDDSKIPYNFSPEPDLIGIRTVQYSPTNRSGYHQNLHHRPPHRESSYDSSPIERNRHKHQQTQRPPFVIGNDDFPPLGGSSSYGKRKMRPWTSDKRRPRSRSLIY